MCINAAGRKTPGPQVPTYLLIEEAIKNSHQQALEKKGGQRGPSSLGAQGQADGHLEGAQEEVKEELGQTQGALSLLIRHKGKDYFMDTQQGDEGQGGPGQPVGGSSLSILACLPGLGSTHMGLEPCSQAHSGSGSLRPVPHDPCLAPPTGTCSQHNASGGRAAWPQAGEQCEQRCRS